MKRFLKKTFKLLLVPVWLSKLCWSWTFSPCWNRLLKPIWNRLLKPCWNLLPIERLRRWERKLPMTREGKLWLLFSLFLLGTGLFRGINLINLLSSFMIAALLYNLWLARRQLRPVRGKRILDEAFFAETKGPITLELRNVRSRPASGVRLIQQGAEEFVVSLAGKAVVDHHGSLTFPQRGPQLVGPLQVRTGFPLGLADFCRELVPAEEIVVLPRVGILRRGALKRHLQEHSPTIGQSRTVPRRHPSAQTDFHGLRVFQPGDSPRWIHWRTSARRGELMVKEFEETPNDNLILIVDPFKPAVGDETTHSSHADCVRCQDTIMEYAGKNAGLQEETHAHSVLDADGANLELALSLAATICWEWCRLKGDRLVLAIAGAEPIVVAGITSRQLALDMLRHLAVQNGEPQTNVDLLLDRLVEIELPTAPTLLISTHGCDFLDDLQAGLHRQIALIDVSKQEHEDFFEWS